MVSSTSIISSNESDVRILLSKGPFLLFECRSCRRSRNAANSLADTFHPIFSQFDAKTTSGIKVVFISAGRRVPDAFVRSSNYDALRDGRCSSRDSQRPLCRSHSPSRSARFLLELFHRFGAAHFTIVAGRNVCTCPSKKRNMILAEIPRYNMTSARKKSLELLNSRGRHL
jgi:hypothetical protein